MIDNEFATCVTVVFDVRIALVIFAYRSVITITNTFSFVARDSDPRMFTAINSRDPNARRNCKFLMLAVRSRLSAHVAQLPAVR